MPPIDVVQMVKNLDQRMSAAEQILPTLATKEDLKAFATKEDLKDDIALIAQHLADVMTRLPPRSA